MAREQIEEMIAAQDITSGCVIDVAGHEYMVTMIHKNDDDFTAPADYAIWVYLVANNPVNPEQTVNMKDGFVIMPFNWLVNVRRYVDG